MLKTNYPNRLAISLGALVPPIAEQVARHGLNLHNAEAWERRHRAWNLLRIGGYLTDAECERVANRLIKGIAQDAYYDTALDNLVEEITGAPPAAAAEPQQEPEPACPMPGSEPEPEPACPMPSAMSEPAPISQLEAYLRDDSVVNAR